MEINGRLADYSSLPAVAEATNFTLRSFNVQWATDDLSVAKDMTLDSMTTLLSTASPSGANGSIQGLVSITSSFRNALPNRPSTTLSFLLKKDDVAKSQHAFEGQFRIRVRVDDLHDRTTTAVQISLPILTGLDWGVDSTSRAFSVKVTLWSEFESDMYQFANDVAAARALPTLEALTNALRPLVASRDIASSPDELASTIASLVREEPALRWLQGPSTSIMVALLHRSPKGESILGKAFHTGSLGTKHQESTAIIALGSNVGDRLEAIEDACNAIDDGPDMRIVRTSNLYESEPMYVEDQSRFLNGVCQVRTEYQGCLNYLLLTMTGSHKAISSRLA